MQGQIKKRRVRHEDESGSRSRTVTHAIFFKRFRNLSNKELYYLTSECRIQSVSCHVHVHVVHAPITTCPRANVYSCVLAASQTHAARADLSLVCHLVVLVS